MKNQSSVKIVKNWNG